MGFAEARLDAAALSGSPLGGLAIEVPGVTLDPILTVGDSCARHGSRWEIEGPDPYDSSRLLRAPSHS